MMSCCASRMSWCASSPGSHDTTATKPVARTTATKPVARARAQVKKLKSEFAKFLMPLIEEFVADYMPTHQGAAVEDLVEELARRWGLKPDKLWEFEAPPGVFVFLLAKALSAKRDEWLRKQLEARAEEEEMYRDVVHFTWCSFFQRPDFVFWWSSY